MNLEVFKSEENILNIDLGKLAFEDGLHGETYTIVDIGFSSKDETWEPVYGERSVVRNNYNQAEITLKDAGVSGKTIRVICRLYDEGIAFRYLFDNQSGVYEILNEELSSFDFQYDFEGR